MDLKLFFLTISFLLLGCNYLLPFNTFINSYRYYIYGVELPFKNELFLPLNNFVYQLGAIGVNTLSLLRVLQLTGHERTLGYAAILGSILCICGIILLSGLRVGGWIFVIGTLSFSLTNSILQSIFDNVNLYFAGKYRREGFFLPYSMGLNLSGTIHGLILLLLILFNVGDTGWTFTIYYLITILILFLGVLPYAFLFKAEAQVEESHLDHAVWNPVGKYYCCAIAINFIVTLFLFPVLLIPKDSPFPLYSTIFIFFGFNFSALLGNMLAGWRPCQSTFYLLVLAILRILFIFLFLYEQIHGFPLDNVYILCVYSMSINILAITSGYISSCCFYGANKLKNSLLNRIYLIRLLNLVLSIGLSVGALASFCVVKYYLK